MSSSPWNDWRQQTPPPRSFIANESPNVSTLSEFTAHMDDDNDEEALSPNRSPRQSSTGSIMEYSDTSNSVEETTTAAGTSSGSAWMRHAAGNSNDDDNAEVAAAQSAFRYRQEHTQPSGRVVRFTHSSHSEGGGDEAEEEDEERPRAGRRRRKKDESSSNAHSTSNNNKNNKPTHRGSHASPHHGSVSSTSTDSSVGAFANNGWISQLAYSFRSPAPPPSRKHADHRNSTTATSSNSSSGDNYNKVLHHTDSSEQVEYPHHHHAQPHGNTPRGRSTITLTSDIRESLNVKQHQRQQYQEVVSPLEGSSPPSLSYPQQHPMRPVTSSDTLLSESSPLLGTSFSEQNLFRKSNELLFVPVADDIEHRKSDADYLALSASFLQDYEAGRAPTLSKNFAQVTPYQIQLYRYKYSTAFVVLLVTAAFALFLSSMLESYQASPWHRPALTLLNFFGIAVFATDIWFRSSMRGNSALMEHTRTSRSALLVKPVMILCIVLFVENLARITVTSDGIVMFCSLFKPLFLFYVSTRARDALEALRRIIRIVLRVIVMELLLILIFAAVATRLFRTYDSFEDLSTSWLSLFELGTTVINPSVWLPMYQQASASAIFFVFYIVTAVFYLHSLVLSVVFQTYIQAASEIHERNAADREDAVQLAYFALQRKGGTKNTVVYVQDVRQILHLVRPHYNAMKINALVEIVDPSNQQTIDLATFRTKIRQALNASIRTARTASPLALLVELVAVAVAVINFVYVILVSSRFSVHWFDSIQIQIGALITILGAGELLVRFNPMRIPDFTPLTRLNPTFDGLALVAAVLSMVGIGLCILGRPMALEYILMGRAIDMIRIMRFFQIFRDIVQRSSDVLPALAGPSILVVASIHLFVYLGMAMWGGAVKVGAHGGLIEDLYDLNNFNSYAEGAITMFQVLVVNDWHAVANVFLYAERCSSPYIVFPFFICGNLVGVSIMLNVLTAFFVESFVTKMEDGNEGAGEVTTTKQKERDFNIVSERPLRRVSSRAGGSHHSSDSDDENAGTIASESSSGLYEFDIYERQGFDTIMQAVSGVQSPDFAQQICGFLEIFESLSPGRERVGYLICDQSTLERFGNQRFRTKAVGFLRDDELNIVVSDMHSELMALSSRVTFRNDRVLVRSFPHKVDQSRILEISAALLQQQPALSIFVCRSKREPTPATIPE